MPTLDRLAQNGLTYTQWHTTALCSPTRSTFLTGRNHHVNRFAAITEGTNGFPGAAGRLPAECATIGQVLQENGYSTFWLGKNHNVPEEDIASGGSRSEWPLNKGFDRFYGFLGGETNNWYPDLVEDNRFIDPPATPEEGYHLSKDLADQAIRMLRDQNSANPSKPWYMWFCPGANHAPHHAPQEYIDKYKGMFDDGYEAYREWVLPRMIEKRHPARRHRPHPAQPAAGRRGQCRRLRPAVGLAQRRREAALRAHGRGLRRVLRVHRCPGRPHRRLPGATGQLENTLIFYCADNGASGEGSPDGSVNENKFFNGFPDDLAENLQYLDTLGSAGNLQPLPHRLGGGVLNPVPDVQAVRPVLRRHLRPDGDPLAGGHPGEGRNPPPVPPLHRRRGHHPRCRRRRDARGLPGRPAIPAERRLHALQLRRRRRADDEEAPVLRDARHPRHLAGRLEGLGPARAARPARATSTRTNGSSTTSIEDRAEAHNLAAEFPDKLKELVDTWFEEADANFVLPLDDRSAVEQLTLDRPPGRAAAQPLHLLPGYGPGPGRRGGERPWPLLQDPGRCRGHPGIGGRHLRPRLTLRRAHPVHQGPQAPLRLQLPRHPAGADLRLAAAGARASGCLGWSSPARLPASTGSRSARPGSTSTTRWSPKGRCGPRSASSPSVAMASASATTAPIRSAATTPENVEFTGGHILGVGIDVSEDQYLDLEVEATAAFARD